MLARGRAATGDSALAARVAAALRGATVRTVLVFELEPVFDLDAARRTVHAFRRRRAARPIIWLDCSAVRSVSPAAAALLARFARRVQQHAILRLLCVPNAVRRTLSAAGLAPFFWQPEANGGPVPDA
jgi:anti-anti-sigma regulatory factor